MTQKWPSFVSRAGRPGGTPADTSNDTKVAQFGVSEPVAQAAPRQNHFVDPEAALMSVAGAAP